MFESHFKLRENPFSLTPNPRFVSTNPDYDEAIAHLLYWVQNNEGFVLVTGEVGTGKTTAIYDLLEKLPREAEVALVTHSTLDARDLLHEICRRFLIEAPEDASKPRLLGLLEDYLLQVRNRGAQALLLIDEAQNLTPELLEEVRLLSNMERADGKLLQIALVGQPELEDKLATPELRQLRQRIGIHRKLTPLSSEDCQRYIHHRLQVAGGNGPRIFPPESCEAVYWRTGGIPREINVQAAKALLRAAMAEAPQVLPEHVGDPDDRLESVGAALAQERLAALGVAAPEPGTSREALAEPEPEEATAEAETKPPAGAPKRRSRRRRRRRPPAPAQVAASESETPVAEPEPTDEAAPPKRKAKRSRSGAARKKGRGDATPVAKEPVVAAPEPEVSPTGPALADARASAAPPAPPSPEPPTLVADASPAMVPGIRDEFSVVRRSTAGAAGFSVFGAEGVEPGHPSSVLGGRFWAALALGVLIAGSAALGGRCNPPERQELEREAELPLPASVSDPGVEHRAVGGADPMSSPPAVQDASPLTSETPVGASAQANQPLEVDAPATETEEPTPAPDRAPAPESRVPAVGADPASFVVYTGTYPARAAESRRRALSAELRAQVFLSPGGGAAEQQVLVGPFDSRREVAAIAKRVKQSIHVSTYEVLEFDRATLISTD